MEDSLKESTYQERGEALETLVDIMRTAMEVEASEEVWQCMIALRRNPITGLPIGPEYDEAGLFQARTLTIGFDRPESAEAMHEAIGLLAVVAAGGDAWGCVLGHAVAAMTVADVQQHGGFEGAAKAGEYRKALAVRGELRGRTKPVYLARHFVIDEGRRAFDGDWLAPPMLGGMTPSILGRRFVFGDDPHMLLAHSAAAYRQLDSAGAILRNAGAR